MGINSVHFTKESQAVRHWGTHSFDAIQLSGGGGRPVSLAIELTGRGLGGWEVVAPFPPVGWVRDGVWV
jgi:hypothetical protein